MNFLKIAKRPKPTNKEIKIVAVKHRVPRIRVVSVRKNATNFLPVNI